MEYTILTNTSAERLTDDVNGHLTQGWRPIGGVSVAIAYVPAKSEQWIGGLTQGPWPVGGGADNHGGGGSYRPEYTSATFAQAMTRE